MTLPPERRKVLTAKAMEYAEAVDDVLPYLLARGISKEAAQLFTAPARDSYNARFPHAPASSPEAGRTRGSNQAWRGPYPRPKRERTPHRRGVVRGPFFLDD